MNPVKSLTFNIIRFDPYFGFPLNNNNNNYALEVYRAFYQKRFKFLSQYSGSKKIMNVICPNGHSMSGYPRKLAIPCNNCQTCWENKDLTPAQKS